MLGCEGHDRLVYLRLAVLDLLSLIKDNIEPPSSLSLQEDFQVRPQKLIGSDDHAVMLKGLANDLSFGFQLPIEFLRHLRITLEGQNWKFFGETRCPELEFLDPLIDDCGRADYQDWSNRLLSLMHRSMGNLFTVSVPMSSE